MYGLSQADDKENVAVIFIIQRRAYEVLCQVCFFCIDTGKFDIKVSFVQGIGFNFIRFLKLYVL